MLDKDNVPLSCFSQVLITAVIKMVIKSGLKKKSNLLSRVLGLADYFEVG